MKKWNLVFDVDLCTGCRNCVVAVKDEYVGNAFPGYGEPIPPRGVDLVKITACERGAFPAVDLSYLFSACQHCDDAPCVSAAHFGAVEKRDDGLVRFDPVKTRGQKHLVDACPFRAVHWNEELSLPQQWSFDAHLLDAGWPAPRPVQACPTGALRALKVDDAEMGAIAREEGLQPLEPGARHATRIHYKNLHRITSAFVAGTLVDSGRDACVAGARVRLLRGDSEIAAASSDPFGDFRFDRLPLASGAWRVEISAPSYRPGSVEFDLADSRWLGEILLQSEGAP